MSLTYTNQRKYKAVTVVCMLGDIYVEPKSQCTFL